MAHKGFALALAAVVAASPLSAQPDSGPIELNDQAPPAVVAPPGGPTTKYCMRVALTGHVMEPVRCWTRAEWADQGIDVDREWAREGVRIIEA